MKVYLDDKREAPQGWRRTYSVKETIELLKTGTVTELSLDHDLSDIEKDNGNEVLLWIEAAVVFSEFVPPKEIKVHSANPSVYPKMLQAIESIKRLAQRKGNE